MPALNKLKLINLLIDSPLREPIKINLIDIVNNTEETNLTKVIPTIKKELEIYQKATQRRLHLAQDIQQQLDSPQTTASNPPEPVKPENTTTPNRQTATPHNPPQPPTPPEPPLPPKPPVPPTPPQPPSPPKPPVPPKPSPEAKPKLDTEKTPPPPPAPKDLNPEDPDEQALAEIQKELEALKNSVSTDAQTSPAPLQTTPKPEPQPKTQPEKPTDTDNNVPPTPSI